MKINIKSFLITSIVIFITAIIWNGVLHMFIIQDLNESIAHLRREDFSEKMGLPFLITAAISMLFVFSHIRERT